MLPLRNNATLLGLHQVLPYKSTGSVLGRTVPDLRLGACRHHGTALLLLILASLIGHFYT